MQIAYKVLVILIFTQTAYASSGLNPRDIMRFKQQSAHRNSMIPQQWSAQNQWQQNKISPLRWPVMMSRPMRRFGQAPRFSHRPMKWPMSLGQHQQQRLNGHQRAPAIQNHSRMPAGRTSLTPQPAFFPKGKNPLGGIQR